MFARPLGKDFLLYNKLIFGDSSLLIQGPPLNSFRKLSGGVKKKKKNKQKKNLPESSVSSVLLLEISLLTLSHKNTTDQVPLPSISLIQLTFFS